MNVIVDERHDRLHDRDEFRARCGCTWQGPWKQSHHDAVAVWHEHTAKAHATR